MKNRSSTSVGILVLVLAGGCGVGTDPIGSQTSPIEGAIFLAPRMRPAGSLVQIPSSPITSRNLTAQGKAVPTDDLLRAVPTPDLLPCDASGDPTALVQSASLSGLAVPSKVSWRFEVARIKTIYLAALVQNLCGSHVAAFDLFAPDGSYHGRLLAPFVAEGDGEGARRVAGGYVVEVALPIAALSAGSLLGTWSVNFSVDADSLGDALGVGLFELLP